MNSYLKTAKYIREKKLAKNRSWFVVIYHFVSFRMKTNSFLANKTNLIVQSISIKAVAA